MSVDKEKQNLDKIDLLKLSQSDVIKLIGVSSQTVRNWAKSTHDPSIGKFPSYKMDGRQNVYSWIEILAWYVRYQAFTKYKDAITSVTIDGNPKATKEEGDARRSMATAQLAELELAQAQDKLVDAKEVEDQYSDLVLKIRSKLLALPARFAAITVDGLAASEKEDKYQDELYIVLKELAEHEAS